MSSYSIIWDLETVPDLAAFKRMSGTPDITDEEAEALLGDKFAKLPLHSIVCIGALIAERGEWGWRVVAIGAPHTGERTEREIIAAFVARLEELRPQLVAFNGHGFDLPVLRYRAMMHALPAPGLNCRSYFNRYTEDCLDLCDALASFDARGKVSLDALCRVPRAGGEAGGDRWFTGGGVREGGSHSGGRRLLRDGYRQHLPRFLRYELFRGNISVEQYERSEADVVQMLRAKAQEKPHLGVLLG